MTTICATLDTEFSPTGAFTVQTTGGDIRLLRKGSVGAAFTTAGHILSGQSVDVMNPATGATYKMVASVGNPVAQADQ